jgi:hypothetical protein
LSNALSTSASSPHPGSLHCSSLVQGKHAPEGGREQASRHGSPGKQTRQTRPLPEEGKEQASRQARLTDEGREHAQKNVPAQELEVGGREAVEGTRVTGSLRKRGQWNRAFKTRFFVLDADDLVLLFLVFCILSLVLSCCVVVGAAFMSHQCWDALRTLKLIHETRRRLKTRKSCLMHSNAQIQRVHQR